MGAVIAGNGGPRTWSLRSDDLAHRDYTVVYRVKVDSRFDGPAVARTAPGLPSPGDSWNIDNDSDPLAKCTNRYEVVPVHDEGEPNHYFDLTFTFTTRSFGLCSEEIVTDPLDLPQRISGSFVRTSKEATVDRFGNPIVSSSHEPIRGPEVEFDFGHMTVRIEQNSPTLDLGLCNQMMNTLNRYPLWGLPRRTIKLSEFDWDKRYRENCSAYYVRVFVFEIKFDWRMLPENELLILLATDPLVSEVLAEVSVTPLFNEAPDQTALREALLANAIQSNIKSLLPNVEVETWDRDVLDSGYKVLNGHWGVSGADDDEKVGAWVLDPVNPGVTPAVLPNPANPAHFIRFTDPAGNYIKTPLNGFGLPFDPDVVPTEFYDTGLAPALPIVPPEDDESGLGPPANPSLDLFGGGFLIPIAWHWAITTMSDSGESTVSAPTAIVIGRTSRAVRIQWDEVTGATGYRVYRRRDAGDDDWHLIGQVGAGGTQGVRHIEKYDESDFLKLGIPAAL